MAPKPPSEKKRMSIFEAMQASVASAAGMGADDEEAVVLEAVLHKKGSGGGLIFGKSAAFKKRKFELVKRCPAHCRDGEGCDVGPVLRYYDAAGAHFKGAILLDGCEVNALPAATRPQDKFVFEVVSGERRNYVLACATEELRGEWLQKLEEEISRHSEILSALAPEAKTKRRASIQSAKAAADEESAEAEAADDDGDAPEEPAERPPLESPGSKKGSMFNLFKRSSSKDLGAGPRGRRPPAPGASTERKGEALCAGPLHYKTVVKSMFGGSKAVWKKRKMELVPSSSDDVGPVLRCTKTKGSGDKKEALFQIVLEGCTVRDDDAKPTKKAAAFAINHATYTEPKVFYADGNDERDKWTEQLKAAVADYKESRAKEAESAPAEVAKKTETIKKARRASLTLEESVAHVDDDADDGSAAAASTEPAGPRPHPPTTPTAAIAAGSPHALVRGAAVEDAAGRPAPRRRGVGPRGTARRPGREGRRGPVHEPRLELAPEAPVVAREDEAVDARAAVAADA
ncbi:hypothetical protein JL720_10037 [Aureococcus anophagefferens]|nr:hypothetical protein JL720_10037 [Aureococcus anophagefferens]